MGDQRGGKREGAGRKKGSKNKVTVAREAIAEVLDSRIDAYYLHRGRSEWSLWSKYWDDNWGAWEHNGIGTVHRRGVNQEQAAALLLMEFWKYDAQNSNVDRYHWINETGYLSVAELSAIAREVWK
jgi:hypothetical protein